MIWKLASASEIEDPSWIKPGKVSWDWWNDNNIYGVDFKAGINTETYKYYIDFASNYNLEYIILDEGWYHLEDVLKIKKEINLPELLAYAESKNVGIILWVTWKALYDQLDLALQTFEDWGVKGIKVDFMQRDDQWMVNYYTLIAEKAAQHHLLVDFHGAYKPTGLHRTYPNVITFEGVAGMEQSKWGTKANPEHDLILPFIRMVAGPMDYTPGAMKNASQEDFRPIYSSPMSQGTRCHQLAMYVVFESPLQMLSDNPSNYLKEAEAMKFLEQVPTTWDDTKVLSAKVSDYILLTRKSKEKWFIGAMTDWDERYLSISFDFLDEGDYMLQIWQDGINADKHGADFQTKVLMVDKKTILPIHLAKGGGWVGILKPATTKD
jgi:alpha-glucosidase